MSISRIVNNIASVNANRNLDKTGRALSKSIERLSSGLRINRAGDDAAGLSVANRLRTQVQGLDQAIANAESGMNVINVAEGALDESTTRLNRIRQLAIQSANTGVNDIQARRALQDEVFQNIDEITRIANTTQYGGNYLLNGDFSISTGLIEGQQNIGLSIDSSPVASTLTSGKSFINIIKIQDGSSQIIAGEEGTGNPQTVNLGITNQTDIAVSMGLFTQRIGFQGLGSANVVGSFFNNVSMAANDTFVFEGVLADGVTKYTGTFSIGAAATTAQLATAVQTAIDDAEKALFGVNTTNSVPTAYRTTVTMGTGDNAGRLEFTSRGEFFNEVNINITVVRNGEVLTRSNGVTRSGAIGDRSVLTGAGQVGNNIAAITGSTFGAGQFEIVVKDVQAAQQRITESSVLLRDINGAVINRTLSIGGTAAHTVGVRSMVLNGTFVGGVYTGGTTMQNGDTMTLTGTNVDGTTFTGTYTFHENDAAATDYDTSLNDFAFGSISGLIAELNFRTRDYAASATGVEDGDQTRFEDAMFTFSSTGSLQLIDDVGRSNSQTTFTLTFQREEANTLDRDNFTIQDDAYLQQEGFAEQATFSIEGGEAVRAEAGDVITLVGPAATKEGVPQSTVTLRVGSGLTAGSDKLETTADLFTGTLNGGEKVTFGNGSQDVVFVDGNSGGNRGVSRFVTVDFDNIIDVTARTDGLPDAGTTIIISTNNSSLNFHIGAQAYQSFRASIGNLTSENLGFGEGSGRTVSNIDISSLDGANQAIIIVDEALSQINKTRSILGAATNRMEAAINNLSVSSENLLASESRIRDADMAKESTKYTTNQVLQQAGLSVLAQANMQSQGFLSLLG